MRITVGNGIVGWMASGQLQTTRTHGLALIAAKTVSASPSASGCDGWSIKQRMTTWPRLMKARWVEVIPFLERSAQPCDRFAHAYFGTYGTCRIRECLFASDLPKGSKGSLSSLPVGIITGVRRTIICVSARALTLGRKFAESWTSVARLARFSLIDGAVDGPGSWSGSVFLRRGECP